MRFFSDLDTTVQYVNKRENYALGLEENIIKFISLLFQNLRIVHLLPPTSHHQTPNVFKALGVSEF